MIIPFFNYNSKLSLDRLIKCRDLKHRPAIKILVLNTLASMRIRKTVTGVNVMIMKITL